MFSIYGVYTVLLHAQAVVSNSVVVNQIPIIQANASVSYSQHQITSTPKIAIIGAGITGASIAHHLHQFLRLDGNQDIKVFEAGAQVGGRIRSAAVHGTIAYDVESGAASFSDTDWCLKDAMQEVGLRPVYNIFPYTQVGIWDGFEMILSYPKEEGPLAKNWWRSPEWLWRYGQSLRNLRDLALTTAKSFSEYLSLRYNLNPVELLREKFGSDKVETFASAYFEQQGFHKGLVNEFVRPECRHRHALDLHEINALSASLALQPNSEIAIYQGNKRLPNRMLKISEAKPILNTKVTHITLGQTRRWKLRTQSTKITDDVPLEEDFDIIIITSPLTTSGITFDPLPVALAKTANIPTYVDRYITLFSTLEKLSPRYFGMPSNTTLPEKILTAPRSAARPAMPSNEHDDHNHADHASIYSITVVARYPPEDAGDSWDKDEYVYKIISSRPVEDETVANMLGYKMNEDNRIEDFGVTWIHRHEWAQSYLKFDAGAPSIEDMQIAPDLYYTASAVEVYNTMEMGCRMGQDLAKFLYYEKLNTGDMIP